VIFADGVDAGVYVLVKLGERGLVWHG
jgi:hypothetical protein